MPGSHSVAIGDSLCHHCDGPIQSPFEFRGEVFCCLGCLSVYQILKKDQLLHYQKLPRSKQGAIFNQKNYSLYDDQLFAQKFITSLPDNSQKIEFFLEGVNCAACLYVVEKLPQTLPGVLQAKLSLANNVVEVIYDPKKVKLSEIANKLNSYGHPPHPLSLEGREQQKLEQVQLKLDLIRVGVAGAFAGNIMIYSFALYSGASGLFFQYFRWITLALSLPVFLYSGKPFFIGALSALAQRRINFDVPLALGILLAFVAGAINVWRGSGEVYFDSVATLIFFLLSARVAMRVSFKKGLGPEAFKFFFKAEDTLVLEGNTWVARHVDFLRIEDHLQIEPQKGLPADGVILKGTPYLDTSMLSGEPLPQKFMPGDWVKQGMINVGNSFEMIAKKTGEHTELAKLIEELEKGWKGRSQIAQKGDWVAERFLSFILILGIITFFYYGILLNQWEQGLQLAITLIIVTCPCGLALTPPLAFIRSLKKGLQMGMVIKNESSLEKLSQIKEIIFDKTGTLTQGSFTLLKEDIPAVPSEIILPFSIQDLLFTLESHGQHPVAKCLVKNFQGKSQKVKDIFDIQEIPGVGVKGFFRGKEIWARSVAECTNEDQITVGLYLDQKLLGTWALGDSLRTDSYKTLKILASQYELSILSGDQESRVNHLAQNLGVPFKRLKGNLSAMDKKNLMKTIHQSLFVGDGHNDSLAMMESTSSISVQGAGISALRSCAAYFSRPGISLLPHILILSQETMRLLRRNYVLSFLYNLVAIYFTFNGKITALGAAILMPLSSLTVLGSTLLGTKKMRSLK